jgi:hypothetical protein
MDGDRATILSERGTRRPRTARLAVHAGILAAVVLGSGIVAHPRPSTGPEPATRAARATPTPPPYLHRYSTCCNGSKDPSMEVY